MILVAVGWYMRFSLSYRELEELLNERGLRADHVTVWRWVQRYVPEIERRATTQFASDRNEQVGPCVVSTRFVSSISQLGLLRSQ